MTWFVLAILHVIGTAFANIARKILLKNDKSDAVGAAIIFQFTGCAITAVFAFWHGFVMPPILDHPLNFLIQASFWGFATLTLFKAYQYIEASEVTVLTTLEAVFTIIVALVFLHEVFTGINVIGTVLIIIAVVYLSQTSSKMKFNKGVLFAVIYSILAGVAIVNDTYMLRYADVLSYLTVGFFTPGLFMLAVNPKVVTRMRPLFAPSLLKKNFTFTLLYTLAGIAFFLALATGGSASQVATIAQASVVLTVFLAMAILNERDHIIRKIICAVLVTIGVLLLR